MTKDKSGFDMGETIDWYEKTGVRLPTALPEHNFKYHIENEELIELSENELGCLWQLFPENAKR